MNAQIYYRWHQPSGYVQHIESLLPKPSVFIKCFEKLFKNIFRKETIAQTNAIVQIDRSGIHSNWKGIESLIKFEEILGITLDLESISGGKIRVIQVIHYEDLETKIPDESTFAIPEDLDINDLKRFFIKKGVEIEDRINMK